MAVLNAVYFISYLVITFDEEITEMSNMCIIYS